MKREVLHSYMSRQHMLRSNYEIYHYLDKTIKNVALHHHDFYELYFLLSGEVDYLVEGKIYKLNPGDIVLLNTRELHQAVIRKGAEKYERIVLWVDKAYLESMSTEHSNLAICYESPEKQTVISTDFDMRREVQSLLNKILAIEDFKGMGSDILSRAYLMELFVIINNILLRKDKRENINTIRSTLIDKVIEYIEENLGGEVSIDNLSDTFFISKYHMSREFKKYTGITIHRYIILKRLIAAKELILQKEAINEVYMKCGFGDYSNFFRAFKNEYGITPKQFYEIMKEASESAYQHTDFNI
jgi:AraC-like DNA-binding protein